MKQNQLIALLLTGLVIFGVGAFAGHSCGSGSEKSEGAGAADLRGKPIARVEVAPIQRKRIEEELTAYGTVAAARGKSRALSVPYECRVVKVMVSEGQMVNAGSALLQIEASPASALDLSKARSEQESAAETLKLVKERLDMKLATRQELIDAELRHKAAESLLQSLERRGVRQGIIKAPISGVISAINVQQGRLVPAGDVMVEETGANQINVRLGVETEDIGFLSPGQNVILYPVNTPGAHPVTGLIGHIERQVNPVNRLVDVYVEPAPDSNLLLNDYVRGTIVAASEEGLVVPRSAVLPDDTRYILFTIKDGRAVKHIIEIGLENKQEIQVIGPDLSEGLPVVIVGNSELEAGMAVEVQGKR